MTPAEPPRRPKPITREQATEVARMFHGTFQEKLPPEIERAWEDAAQVDRDRLIDTILSLLDQGEIVALDHRECHAVTELLANVDVGVDGADAAPLDNAFKGDLVRAFRKLAFASGRQYGLTNFDMGIEEDPS